uniref:Uncharacterized protein n=1 Tax=Bionectria ochroleuca TaxID=29856 RepID=A0A8H7N870_BIOOC
MPSVGGGTVMLVVSAIPVTVLTIIAGIAIIILTLLILFMSHRQGDEARTGIPWVKASCCLFVLGQIFKFIASVLQVTSESSDDAPGKYKEAMSSAQLEILSNIFCILGYAAFVSAQIEFARGMQMIDAFVSQGGSPRLDASTGNNGRMLNYATFIVVLLPAIGFFVDQQLVINTDLLLTGADDEGMSPLLKSFIALYFAPRLLLGITTLASLFYTIRQPRSPPHNKLGTHLLAISTLTAIRHVSMAVIAGIDSFSYRLSMSAKSFMNMGLALRYAEIILGSWLYVICLGMAFGITRMSHGGLRLNNLNPDSKPTSA